MSLNVVDHYSLDMSGASDNSARLAALATDIDALFKAQKALPQLVFTEGILAFDTWPHLAYPNIQIIAEGECHLRHTGAGDAVTFSAGDITKPTEQGQNNITFSGFLVETNGKDNGLVINACHRSRFDVAVQGPNVSTLPTGTAGIVVNFAVCTEIRPRVALMGAGLVFNAWPGRPDLPPTICTVTQPILENCGYGLYMVSAAQTRVYGGTIEGCNIGIQIDSGGTNHFHGIDMEANKSYDAVTSNAAHDNKFFYCATRPATFKSQFNGWNNRLIYDIQDGLFGL